MGLVDLRSKMALSPASASASSSPDSAIIVTSESSSPPAAAPKKKRTFDIAFLTGQSETSNEATAITRNEKFSSSSAQAEDDDYHSNNRFTVLSQNSAAAIPKTEGSLVTNQVFSVCSGTNSSFDAINNGSCQDDKDLLGPGSKYKLFEGNNNNSNGYLIQNLWKDQNNADTRSNPKTSGKGSSASRKNKSSQAQAVQQQQQRQHASASKSSGQGTARSDSKKSNDLSPQLHSSPSDMHYLPNQHHMKDESSSPERQSFGNAHLRTNNELVTSASFQSRSMPPSSFGFLPQIGRFPIHLPSPLTGSNHQSTHNGNGSATSHPLHPQSSTTFPPPILNEKLSKEQHQQIISAFHHHQQQQQNTLNKIRAAAANGFSPENLYPPYSPYPSAAAAAFLLSQSSSSSIGNLGLMNSNSGQAFQHNGNNNVLAGSNGTGAAPPNLSPPGNPMTTATLLPPSLTSLTLPAQNVCAKCNIGFRMTSDLVYHMRSHHKRETDPMKKKREDKLKCMVCLETFRERHHLTRHMTAHQDRAEEMMHDAAIEHEIKPTVVASHCG